DKAPCRKFYVLDNGAQARLIGALGRFSMSIKYRFSAAHIGTMRQTAMRSILQAIVKVRWKPSVAGWRYANALMSEKPRILGLDVGDRRIGVAISDPLHITAAGLETIIRQNMDTDVQKVSDVARRHNVKEIVIGIPLNMDGSQGEQSAKVMAFGKKL